VFDPLLFLGSYCDMYDIPYLTGQCKNHSSAFLHPVQEEKLQNMKKENT
jgi:hypothetical protein